MERTNIYATTRQLDRLRLLAKKTGLPMSELIRRAIDAFLKSENK